MTQIARVGAATLLSVTLLLLLPSSALAQLTRGGNGIKVGEGRLHTFFDFETRYDSAAGFFPSAENPALVSGQLSPEVIMVFRPGLRLDIASPTVAFGATASAGYVWYTEFLTAGSNGASHIQANADVNATFNPDGAISLELEDRFVRSDRTRTAAVGAGVLSLYNEVGAALRLRPGGGALEFSPNASWGVEFFKPLGSLAAQGCTDITCDPLQVSNFNYSNLHAGLEGRWRFLPKTAIVLDADYDVRSYAQAAGNPGAQLLRATAGLAGLISPRIAVLAVLGWGHDFGATQSGTLIAQADLTYLFSEASSLKGGYVRTMEPVAAFGLFRDDRVFVEGRMLMGGRLNLRGYGAFDYLTFAGTAPRTDQQISLDLGPELQVSSYFIIAAGYLYTRRSSEGVTANAASLNFSRNEAYLRLTLTY